MKQIQKSRAIAWLLLFFLLSSCQNNPSVQTDKGAFASVAGKKCGVTRGSFLGSWFDYYERALSFADCEMWQASEQDLKKALKKRSVDRRRVYSLGMHLVSDYFPHRELGVAYFYQKKYQLAEQEFNISMSQFPTSKSETYLKRIRLIKLEQQRQQDKQPPLIRVMQPADQQWLEKETIRLKALVEDNHFIDSVQINGKPYRYVPEFRSKAGVPVRVARKVKSMHIDMPVKVHFINGKGRIRIVATDISGNQSSREIVLFMDQQGPDILVRKIQPQGGQYRLLIDVSDRASAIAQIKINNKLLTLTSQLQKDSHTGQKIRLIHIDEVIDGGSGQVIIEAVDERNNRTSARLKLKPRPRQGQVQASAPEIYLDRESDRWQTQEAFAYIAGEVESESDITSIKVNGASILNARGKHIYFNYQPHLEPGTNTFHLVVGNARGKTARRKIVIERLPTPERALSERLKMAQFPFPCNEISRAPCFHSAGFYPQLYQHLMQRQRFQLAQQQVINQLLDQTTACRDGARDECVVAVANKLTSRNIWNKKESQVLFAGHIIERKSRSGRVSVEVSGRIIDNHSKEILTTVDLYSEADKGQKITNLVSGMTTEISDAFPLVEAAILQVDKDQLRVDFAESDRLWPNMPLLVFDADKKQACSDARIRQLYTDYALASVLEPERCNFQQSRQLKVITR